MISLLYTRSQNYISGISAKKAGTCHGVTSATLFVNCRNPELPINHHAKGQNVDTSVSTSPESLLQQSAENGNLIAAAEIFSKPFSFLTFDPILLLDSSFRVGNVCHDAGRMQATPLC